MPNRKLESIYQDYQQALFTLALSITGCRATAEDCIQQAFVRLSRRKFFERKDLASYVFRSVRNASIDATRKAKSQAKVNESVFNGYVPPPQKHDVQPDANLLTAERDQIIRAAIDQLPESMREVLLLKTYSDLTFRQIGKVMGSSRKTVATWYRRGLKELKSKLESEQ